MTAENETAPAVDAIPVEWFRQPENHGLTIDALGQWVYRGAAVEHPSVQALFHRGLSLDDDGRVRLTVGDKFCYIAPADTAFFVRGMTLMRESTGEVSSVEIELNNGHTENLDAAALAISGENVLYCRVYGGRAWARFERAKQQQLLDAALIETGDEYAVVIGGEKCAIGRR